MDKQRLAVKSTDAPWQRGMTLVELMIAMVLSSFAIAAIVMSFRSQDASSLVQEAVTSMQQNNGAAMDIMTKEIRMAGYDPTESGTPAILTATSSSLRFTADLNGDGDTNDTNDTNEDVTYGFTAANDANGDGVADSGAAELGRKTGAGTLQDMAENIQAINFAYAYDSNGDGVLETSGGNTIWAFNSGGTDINGDGVIDALDGPTGSSFNLSDIRAIKIWILARSDRQDAKYSNTNTYTVGRQVITPNDKFYRRLLTSTVTCRNLGM